MTTSTPFGPPPPWQPQQVTYVGPALYLDPQTNPQCRKCGQVVWAVETTHWLCARCSKQRTDEADMEERIFARVMARLAGTPPEDETGE